MKTANYFYNRFINEENLRNIPDVHTQNKFHMSFGLIPLFLIISVGAVSHFGYNIMLLATAFSVLVALMSLYVVISCAIGMILRSRKYRIFKKQRYLIIFLSLYFILAITFYILSFFTVSYSIDDGGNVVGLNINVLFYYAIFLPIIIGYTIFCYFAYGKCFNKYTINKKAKQKEYSKVIHKENTNAFYNKFISEENLKKIGDEKVWNKLSQCYVMIPILTCFSVFLILFIPFISFISIWFAFIFLLIACKCIDSFTLIDRKHQVFKKHKYLNIFLSMYVISVIVICVPFIFTAKFDDDTELFSQSTLNTVICLYVYILLLFGYTIFTYYAYGKCIIKYAGEGYLNKKENTEVEEIKYEYDDDDGDTLSTYNPFYNKFVNEEALKNIEDIEEQNSFSKSDVWMAIWSLASTFCITYAGFGFEHWYNILLFILAILSLLASLYFAIKLIALDRKHHVFKKHLCLHLFIWVYFILMIAIYVLAYFDIRSPIPFVSSNELSVTLMVFWCIYIPLFFIYDRFCTRAYKDCLLEYTKAAAEYRARKRKKRKKKEDNMEDVNIYDISEVDLDDNSSD